MSGFDDHDTHHEISAYVADPWVPTGRGRFPAYQRRNRVWYRSGYQWRLFRYAPQLHKLERTAQLAIPNPWGIAFDAWGQPIFAETSSPDVRWMLPGTVLPRYGEWTDKSNQLIEESHRVRPTSGLEFVSSRHFPDEVQGNFLINNTIGFLGMKDAYLER